METEFISFWNKKELNPPSLGHYRLVHDKPDCKCAELAKTFEDILSSLKDFRILKDEAALISQFLYRTKKKLRNHKGYKCLQKIRRCLKSYESIDLSSVIERLRISTHGGNGPSKEALEWCLISLLRCSTLLHRLQNTCLESANHFYNHLTTGDNWNSAILLTASISRVWILSQYCVNLACEWYMSIKEFMPYLRTTEQWLPENYDLPTDLKVWLGNPEYIKNKTRNENIEDEGENAVRSQNVQPHLTFEDFGEVIQRNSADTSSHKEIRIRETKDMIYFNIKESKKENWPGKRKSHHLNRTEWKHISKKKYFRR